MPKDEFEGRAAGISWRYATKIAFSKRAREVERRLRDGERVGEAELREAGLAIVNDFLIPFPADDLPVRFLERSVLVDTDTGKPAFEVEWDNLVNGVAIYDLRSGTRVQVASGLAHAGLGGFAMPLHPAVIDLGSHERDVMAVLKMYFGDFQKAAIEEGIVEAPRAKTYSKDRDRARTLGRLLALQQTTGREVRVADVARSLGLSHSTTRRLLAQAQEIFLGAEERRDRELEALLRQQAADDRRTEFPGVRSPDLLTADTEDDDETD